MVASKDGHGEETRRTLVPPRNLRGLKSVGVERNSTPFASRSDTMRCEPIVSSTSSLDMT